MPTSSSARPLHILTSWPTAKADGSGTVTFLEGFVGGLHHRGVPVVIEESAGLPPIQDYGALLARRARINQDWATQDWAAGTDLVTLDWDGHLLTPAQRTERQVIATPRGLFADLIHTEPELAALLSQQAAWEQQALTQADWTFVASHYAKRQAVHYYHLDPQRIAVLPNGINPAFLRALAQAEPFNWPLPTILAVAKFYPRKQIPLLIEAFADCRAAGLEARLCVIGDGFEEPRIRALIAAHRLADWVELPGAITDLALLARYYRSCTLFCHPSIQETFGNVLLEALAAGKPIVTTDAASMPEVAGSLGFYVPPGDREALAEALESALVLLLNQPDLQTELTLRAQTRAAEFTWERTARDFEQYRQLWRESGSLGITP